MLPVLISLVTDRRSPRLWGALVIFLSHVSDACWLQFMDDHFLPWVELVIHRVTDVNILEGVLETLASGVISGLLIARRRS